MVRNLTNFFELDISVWCSTPTHHLYLRDVSESRNIVIKFFFSDNILFVSLSNEYIETKIDVLITCKYYLLIRSAGSACSGKTQSLYTTADISNE